ncbi:MAG: hypothetical protein PHV23_05170 [Candidatus Gracilibacteria bacterium]|nr:hypothetical protein [Candidatus Gracilibacteria bacterium]
MNGFYIVMGEFGSGKTQNITKYLKVYNPKKEINISNYYNGYSQFQISNHTDLINILSDIYDYHQYINLYEYREKLYTHKKSKLPTYLEGARLFHEKYGNNLQKNIKFNIALDEASIYFNPRDFKNNFGGENVKLLDFIYQPRKLNLLFLVVVQNPLELDVKFRRLASYYRKYYKGFRIIRWHKDYYFPNPEEMDFEKADIVGRGVNFNFYPLFPKYDYNTKELIKPGESIYNKGDLLKHLSNNFTVTKKRGKKLNFNFNFLPLGKLKYQKTIIGV